ncbi:N-acetylglucosaminidase [Turicibacter sanguinis]|uniref:N-acetylglucosaminidase n=1 Tax=Turicibacter sanguinis TaxID=154288 RepID=UPI00189B62AF|nr:glucosaminidase domain-containing protein [Turicibacter sanguinis]
MNRKRGKKAVLKGTLAIGLLINQFSSFGAIVNATVYESEVENNSDIVQESIDSSQDNLPDLDGNLSNESTENEEIQNPGDGLPEEIPNDEEFGETEDAELEIPKVEEDLDSADGSEESKSPEEQIEEELLEETASINLEDDGLFSIESRSSGSGLVQLWQVVPDGQQSKEGKTTSEIMKALQCKPNHNLYPSGGQSEHNTYVNSCYVDDALYLGEDTNYYYIYLSGYEGKVPKSESHWFELDLNNDGTKVKYEIQTVAYYIPGGTTMYSLQEKTEPLDVPELNYYDQYLDKYNDINERGITTFSTSTVQSPSYYANENGTLVHYLTSNVTKANSYSKVIVGKAPSWMSSNIKYYSYDGIYFYTNWRNIKVNGQGAVNQSNPFYNYYQYLPVRSKSNYSANIFDNYTNSNGGAGGKLVNTGQYFYAVQDNYGINGALQYAMGIHESGWGKSSLSIDKNNLFGMNATDNNPYGNGTSFPSVEAGINYHADRYLSWGYTDPIDDWRYMGSHVGNKGSGMNVRYASDPFWGEKIAGWYYRFDSASGLKDYDYYTIGIKQSNAVVDVKSQANSSSSTLYQTMNKNSNIKIANYPFLIVGDSNGFYKIKTDTPIVNGKPSYSATYKWGDTYGYIPQSSVFLTNHSLFLDPFDTGEMLNHVDGISCEGQQFKIDGWAFINGLNMDSKDEFTTSILVKNNDNQVVQRFGVTPMYSTDLSDWKNQSLNYARYTAKLDLSSLPVGNYTVVIEIKTSYFTKEMSLTSNYHLSSQIGYGKGNKQVISMSAANQPLQLKVSNLNQETHADNVDVKSNGDLYVYGWSTLEGLNMNQVTNFERYIVIKNSSGQEVKREKATSLYDNALSDWNKQPQDYARFKVNIPIKDLPIGTYDIYVELKTPDFTKQTLLQSNYHMEEVRTSLAGKTYSCLNAKAQTAVQLNVTNLDQVTHTDTFEMKSDGTLYIYGWSTLEGLNMNQVSNFERSIIVKNSKGQEVQRVNTIPVYSTDLSDWNKQPQNYARFNANIDLKKMIEGSYDIYVELKTKDFTKQTKLASNFAFSQNSKTMYGQTYITKNSGIGTAMNLVIEELNQVTHIDSYSINLDGNLSLYGWSTLEGLNMNDNTHFSREILILDQNNNEMKRETVIAQYATDLSDWNKQPQDYARFKVNIAINDLSAGEYKLVLMLKTTDFIKNDELKSNYNYNYNLNPVTIDGKTFSFYNSGEGTTLKLKVK